MIAGIFHQGSGLGDQLFRYITVRTLAEDKGFKWGMVGNGDSSGKTHVFKGHSFMKNIGCGDNGDVFWMMKKDYNKWNETVVRNSEGVDIRSYDPEINFVEDNTLIDGSFEDDKYWRHNLKNINKWLEVESLDIPDDLCIIGFRGGEYASIPELFLPKDYYEEAITKMRAINPNMRFQVHTDDPALAKQFFPDFEVVENTKISHSKHSNMGFNWRSARFAKYAIIPNSAFFIIPRILRHQDGEAVTIAPRYWARRKDKIWARPACYYPEFRYL